jgi:hypothetical protein
MNAITELPINDKTASHTLTAADAGDYVVMNSASATTITVNTSVFTTGQVVYIVNKGTASTVITAGAGVTVSTSGSLTVPANGCGRLLALSASVFIYEAGDTAASAAGLTLVTAATFTSVTSVSLATNTFSSTYRNYRVHWVVTAVSTSLNFTLRMRASGADNTTSNYSSGYIGRANTASTFTGENNNGTSWGCGGSDVGQQGLKMALDYIDPQQTSKTFVTGTMVGINDGTAGFGGAAFGGFHNTTTQFDSSSLIASTGTITGYVRVYGYADS